jgi:trk system potassium uptake protein
MQDTMSAEHVIDVARLRRLDFFAPLADRELAAIARCCRAVAFPAGTLILRQGEVAKEVFFLEEGAVNVYREKPGQLKRVALIEGPGVFGEMAMVNHDRIRTATVRAATDVQLLAISFANMIAALRALPVLKEQLRKLLLHRGAAEGVTFGAETPAIPVNGAVADTMDALCHQMP